MTIMKPTQRPLSIISGALLISSLAACGTKEVPVSILPPAELTQCDDLPDAPDLPSIDWSSVESAKPIVRERDTAVLAYVLAMRAAYGSCRADVDGLAAWVREVE